MLRLRKLHQQKEIRNKLLAQADRETWRESSLLYSMMNRPLKDTLMHALVFDYQTELQIRKEMVIRKVEHELDLREEMGRE